MEKIFKRTNIHTNHIDWTDGLTIEEIRKNLDDLEKQGVNEIYFEPSDELNVYYYNCRLETDEELEERLKQEKIKFDYIRGKEIQQLKYLQEKYKNEL